MDELTIERQKGPGRLRVWKHGMEFEGDEAQMAIQTVFGAKTFCMEQDANSNFLGMSATGKLEFLQSIAFQETDIEAMKHTVKLFCGETERTHASAVATVTALSPRVPKSVTEPDPLDSRLSELIARGSPDEWTEMIQTRVNACRRDLERAEQRLRDVRANRDAIRNRRARLEDAEMRSRELSPLISDDRGDLATEVNRLKSLLRLRQLYDRINERKMRFRESKQIQIDTVLQELAELRKTVSSAEEEMEQMGGLDPLRESIQSLREQSRRWARILELEQLIQQLPEPDDRAEAEWQRAADRHRELREMTTIYNCPSCSSKVVVCGETLTACPPHIGNLHQEKESARKTLAEATCRVDRDRLVRRDRERYESELRVLERPGKQDRQIRSELSDQSAKWDSMQRTAGNLETMRHRISELERRLASSKRALAREKEDILRDTPSEPDPGLTAADLHDSLRMAEGALDRLEEHLRTRNSLDRLIATLREQVGGFVEEDEEVYQREVSRAMEDLAFWGACGSDIRKYKLQLELKIAQERDILELNRAERTRDHQNTELQAGLGLRDCIAHAESLALEHLIGTINTNVQVYLDAFFREHPIEAILRPFKVTKKCAKPQVNLELQYRGFPTELNTLSGGERDRVALAFMLVFAEMSGTPFIVLDECVSSLDQDNAFAVFDFIREQCEGKLVIAIAHQIVTGIFDQVITLEN